MDQIFKFLIISALCATIHGQGTAQQNAQLQPEFRQQQEPQFQPPPPLANFQAQHRQFQQPQQPQPNFQTGQQQQQQQQRPQFQAQQPIRQQVQPQPINNNINDFASFQPQQQETLPTLPPVFIPPNNPVGPPPNLQSPIRNLFRQPESNTFSISSLIGRFLNLFNFNSN